MTMKSKQTFETKAAVFKALAHPTRLLIVDELSRQERCVCELREMIGDDILRQAGIVRDEKRGLQVWYSLKMPCIIGFFGCVEKALDANARRAMVAAQGRPSRRGVTL
jgi:hypothetical protein